MKRHYLDLLNLNRDLINGYRIRCTNHEELMKNLRVLNQMVQKAANLRSKNLSIQIEKIHILLLVGKYKTITTNQCRAAIKANNAQLLIKTIKTGNV
jgi:Bardet-Biedl syndrome 2 protein